MQPGDVVAARFVVERRAGAGGMGVVFRAVDRVTGEAVALKITGPATRENEGRSRREALLLAELAHPAIVRYVAHGTTSDGEAYLAMEWLDGEDLAARLARAPLTVAETAAVASRVAEGLAAAHAGGVVHRDVKPSNIFLVGGEPARVKVLDFGLARPALASRPMTASGAVLGTVGYMAPEQARGERDIDARADVFSLGCVLFECLTGRPAFAGEHVVAVLAKVLLEDAPRLAEVRPALPASLDALVARMLAKDRAARAADAGEVARALAAIDLGAEAPPAPEAARPSVSAAEQRLVSVVLVDLEDAPDPACSTLHIRASDVAANAALAAIATAHGATITPLASGALLVTMELTSGGLDGAARAAECALSLRKALPEARVALATGRAQSSARGLFGQVVDRAASLLSRRGSAGVIRIDDVTRGLLEARFDVRERGGEIELCTRRDDASGVRTLLGKPTPCVGRDKELSLLEATFDECVAEPVARAVLVTAPAGTGKSRLRHELTMRLRAQGAAVLTAYGDPVGAGSSLGLARQLVRAAAGLRPGDAAEAQQGQLGTYLAGRVAEPDVARLREILGDLVGAPTAAPSPLLRAARNDARLMGDWMRRTFVDWLSAECAMRPLLIMLEDLHWGDLPSVTYVGEALARLADRPLMVLALARPEVSDHFPRLWAAAGTQEIRLGGLTRSAAEKLVRTVLGDTVSRETTRQIVERAAGNAYFLEELIRRVADRESDALPESVLAVAEARIERVEPEARRILRAASIFGEAFWRGGVSLLVGGEAGAREVDGWLHALVDRELLVRATGCRFADEAEYAFRHALTREAAYAMLTDEDRQRGHRLAGEWLERAGEKDALVLAEHFERGGDAARAREFCGRAAQLALAANDLAAAIGSVDRAGALGVTGQERGRLRAIECEALSWRGDFERALAAGLEAMDLLPPDDDVRYRVVARLLLLSNTMGRQELVIRLLDTLTAEPPGDTFGMAKIEAWATAAWVTSLLGESSASRTFLDRLALTDPFAASLEPTTRAWIHIARYFHAIIVRSDPWAALHHGLETVAESDRADNQPLRAQALQQCGAARVSLGAWEEARSDLEEALRLSERHGIGLISGMSRRFLGLVLAHDGDLAGARAITAVAATQLAEMGLLGHELSTRAFLAEVLLRRGDLEAALVEAQRAAENRLQPLRAHALAVLSRVLVALGRADEALLRAREAMALLEELGAIGLGDAQVPLALTEAHLARGDREAARGAVAAARDRLLRRADRIGDARYRAGFLERVEENRRTLELARELLGD